MVQTTGDLNQPAEPTNPTPPAEPNNDPDKVVTPDQAAQDKPDNQ